MTEHDFEHIWRDVPGTSGGRECIALVCRTCGMEVKEPRWRMDRKTGASICGSLDFVAKSCEESAVEQVHAL